MTDEIKYLTAKEFSKITGIPVPAVNRLLRDRKVTGEKKSGKWLIRESELKSPFVQNITNSVSGDPTELRSYSTAEFSKMTYLTEKGVLEWLKNGRLSGEINALSEQRVSASNLDSPDIKRLLRKT